MSHSWVELLIGLSFGLLPLVAPGLMWGSLIGNLAARKNRNGWLWGSLSGVAGSVGFCSIAVIPAHRPPALYVAAVTAGVFLILNLGTLVALARLPSASPRSGAIGEKTRRPGWSLSRKLFWWVVGMILFLLLLILLPNTGLMDIHQ